MMIQPMNVAFVLLALAALVFLGAFLTFLIRWIKASRAGVPITIFSIIAMKLRGNPVDLLIDSYVFLRKQNITTSLDEVEHTFMTHRNRINRVEDLVKLVKETKPQER